MCNSCYDGYNGMCRLVWSNLPYDLMIEVISRLPDKPLARFRCVSKAFYFMINKLFLPRLISVPISGFFFRWENFYNIEYYWKNRRKKNLKPYVYEWFHGYVSSDGIFEPSGGESFVALLPFKPGRDDFWGCFDGFFLLGDNSSSSGGGASSPIRYFVCNPVTKQCLSIPVNVTHLEDSFVGLAIDPFHPPPHHFKIVRVARCPTILSVDQPPELDVFSSATGKWVNYQVHVENPEILGFKWIRRSTYFNGVFYMLSAAQYLLCFHLKEEEDVDKDVKDRMNKSNQLKARAIKLPHTSRDDCVGLFDVSDGCLYYAGVVKPELLVWILQIDSKFSPWIMKYCIRLHGPHISLANDCFLANNCLIFGVDLSEEIIYIGHMYMVYSYNVKTEEVFIVRRMNEGSIVCAESYFYHYSPSPVKLSDRFMAYPASLSLPRNL